MTGMETLALKSVLPLAAKGIHELTKPATKDKLVAGIKPLPSVPKLNWRQRGRLKAVMAPSRPASPAGPGSACGEGIVGDHRRQGVSRGRVRAPWGTFSWGTFSSGCGVRPSSSGRSGSSSRAIMSRRSSADRMDAAHNVDQQGPIWPGEHATRSLAARAANQCGPFASLWYQTLQDNRHSGTNAWLRLWGSIP